MPNFKPALKRSVANGTSLMGYVDCSYQELVAHFGQPGTGDGYKVDAEWVLLYGATVVTIYNYKTGPNYNGGDRSDWEASERDWHIGGNSPRAVDAVKKIFPSARPAR